jgi:hypothetical protein
MIRKTLSTALAVAVISGSAIFASSAPSNATYYGYYNDYGYSYYEPVCFYTWKRIWTYYGFRKIKVQICR